MQESNGEQAKMVVRASNGELVGTEIGDLRANGNNKFYTVAQGTDIGLEYNLAATNVVNLNNLPASSNGTTGYQPYQSFVVNGVTPPAAQGVVYHNVGEKQYELKDHLGNVRVVVSDRKNLDTATDALSADVIAYNNYYPFGMPQPNRNFDSQEYRYGFQGQDKDSEIKGEGLSVNYKYRMHDPRVGRFFAVDPLAYDYPWNSPYAFSENNVIHAVELEGLEKSVVNENGKQSIVSGPITNSFGSIEEAKLAMENEQKLKEQAYRAAQLKRGIPGIIDIAIRNDRIFKSKLNSGKETRFQKGLRLSDEKNLAKLVFPANNENVSVGLSIGVGKAKFKENLLEGFVDDYSILSDKEKVKDVGNQIIVSSKVSIYDGQEQALFLEGGNKVRTITVIAKLASEEDFRLFEIVEKTQLMGVDPISIESREVYVNGTRAIYQESKGFGTTMGSKKFKLGKQMEKFIDVDANIDAKVKTDFKDVKN
ncbi:hypothetical protein LDL77_19230 [Flagellimonas marinaquae]|uniref:RHS repeat domain-containing protein n=1 Tax=Flagellimonas aurea TaxID=2915619 RepID=UPI001CE1E9A9|nr:hypothetical protein LDL77_19230 [Allomuricauda aquimarina]